MVIDDFYGVAMAIPPGKADSPLVIDPNRVLTFAAGTQRLQSTFWRRGQSLQLCRGVKLEQFR